VWGGLQLQVCSIWLCNSSQHRKLRASVHPHISAYILGFHLSTWRRLMDGSIPYKSICPGFSSQYMRKKNSYVRHKEKTD
jgi:hypothetical protein